MKTEEQVMPETPAVAGPAPFDSNALRIVLFGLPDAGKSSLLGALSQAAQTQEHVLNGRLTDVANGLAGIRERTYGEGPHETLHEIVPYPVIYQPFTLAGNQEYAAPQSVVLIDCDGRIANELVMRRRTLEPDTQDAGLAPSVLAADALLLVIDGSAHPVQVDADFTEFARFLRVLETTRGNRTDVAGLPAYLVLTKCDMLAKPGDGVDAWLERIEECKRQVDQRFKEFLASSKENEQDGFGSIALRVWATAIRRPLFPGSPDSSHEPYGVAELFRQAFEDARAFRDRQRRSTRRLVWTGTAATSLVAGMVAMVGLVFSHRHVEEPVIRELAAKVETYRGHEAATSSARLRGDVQPRISELIDLHNDLVFSRLPSEEQRFVQERLDELTAYRDYQDQLARIAPANSARNARELEVPEQALKKLEPPEKYRSDWSQTEAVLSRGRRVEEIKVYRSAIAEVTDWYDALTRKGQGLWTFGGARTATPEAWPDWAARVQSLEDEASAAPFRPGERLSRSSLTYDAVLRYDTVVTARNNWEVLRGRLIRLRDLVAALGLSGQSAGRTPLNLTTSFNVDQASARVQELEKLYPGFRDNFTLTGLPEAAAERIRQAANLRDQYAIAAGQAVVLRHLNEAMGGQKETYESWKKLLPWLAAPEELSAWRVLATILARLQDPAAVDPVNALEAFLRINKLDLSIRQLTLEIPDDAQVRPDGSFTIYNRKIPGETTPYVFERTGDERRDLAKGATFYTF
ncbi:MAG TPA: hypothetical protein VGP68_20950, partial [Gemmataceae bacterium]|nr:hypothetical protein [Gemmataceae bacterium]